MARRESRRLSLAASQTAAAGSRQQVLGTLGIARLGVEYQPIVSLQTGEIVAYEALARFWDRAERLLSNPTVFAALHRDHDILCRVEKWLKQIQLELAPCAVTLFLNLDPHILSSPEERITGLLTELTRHDVVVEIIENTSVHDARAAYRLHMLLRQQNVKVALDDIGARGTLLSLDSLFQADFLKFDRSWFQRAGEKDQLELLKGFIRFARQAGKKTIIEGVETESRLAFARQVGADYVQGYLYQDSFIMEKADLL